MTRATALARVRKLLALAAENSGASPDEARNAAVAAARLVLEHRLLDGAPAARPIDLDDVAALALHAAELEHLLGQERASHAAQLRSRDAQWRRVVEDVRRQERAAAHAARKKATRQGAVLERKAQARAGGCARDHVLTPVQKSEIGRAGAAARWARWRERQGARAPKSNE